MRTGSKAGPQALCGLLVYLVCAAAPAVGQEAKLPPPPTCEAVAVEVPPRIDGVLDDPAWAQASKFTDLVHSSLGTPPPEPTTVYLCYDSTQLYAAFRCEDDQPSLIRAQQTVRGGTLSGDDFVSVAFDTTYTHQRVYEFRANAAGTQQETIPGGAADKVQWRGDWLAAARRYDWGYAVEIAVPIGMLVYPSGQSTFGVEFARQIGRLGVIVHCPFLGNTSDQTRMLCWTGLRLPKHEASVRYMPYVTAGEGQDTERAFDAGADAKLISPSGITALATVNPDFQNIEDTVQSIAFSFTERYRADARPFFTEGADGYFPGSDLFYSRRIEAVDLGVKAFGELRHNAIGVVATAKREGDQALVANVRHNFSPYANLGGAVTVHNPASLPHSIAGRVSGRWDWFAGANRFSVQGHLEGADTYYLDDNDQQAHARGGRGYVTVGNTPPNGGLAFSLGYTTVDSGYRPSLALDQDRGYAGPSVSVSRSETWPAGLLSSRGWSASTYDYRKRGGGSFDRWTSADYWWAWRQGRYLCLIAGGGERERVANTALSVTYSWNTKSLYESGSLSATTGRREGGGYRYLSLSQGLEIRPGWTASLSFEASTLRPPAEDAATDTQTVLTTAYQLTPEKTVAARLLHRDGEGLNFFASYGQRVRKGMDAFLLLGNPDPETRGLSSRIAGKFVWTLE